MVATGDVLGGRYQLVEHLGGGGMADVFRGLDRNLQRDVAVKVLASRRLADASMIDRFRREARSAASLNHPNVVSIHDTGEDGDTYYIVMELIEGPTLDDRIDAEGVFDAEQAAAIVSDVCAGLAAAHAKGVVHRDVKPSNIMFTGSGTVKVSDFGIARVRTDATVTETGTVYGSVPFIAPEVARGDDVDGRADVYAVGCVLFTMLAGAPPFAADDPLGIIYQHLHATRPRPSDVNPAVPDDLDAVVLRCLAADREQRYANVEELRRDLDAFLAGRTPPVALGGVAATQLLPPVDETVAIRPAADARPRPPYDERGWGARRWLIIVVIVAAALITWAVLGGVLAGDGGQPADRPTGEAPPAQTEPTPTVPSPTPTETVPTEGDGTVEDLLGDLIGALTAGASTGAIDAEAARDLARGVREVAQHLERGQSAAKRIEELRSRIEDLEDEGRIEPDAAATLLTVLDQLSAAVGDGGEGDAGDD